MSNVSKCLAAEFKVASKQMCPDNHKSIEINGYASRGQPRLNGTHTASTSVFGGASVSSARDQIGIVIIDERYLIGECFARSLRTLTDAHIAFFPNVEGWLEVDDEVCASAIIFCETGTFRDVHLKRQMDLVLKRDHGLPIIVMGDSEEPQQIVDVLESGARAYLLTSLSLAATLQAVRLAVEGGEFVPAESLIAAHRRSAQSSENTKSNDEMFTSRQAAVVEALRRGKPNKIIAHELNMCESTVKVHVRHIMKKLRAKNRTEVAVIMNSPAGRLLKNSTV